MQRIFTNETFTMSLVVVMGCFFLSVAIDTCVNTAGSANSGTSQVTMKPGNGESAEHEIRPNDIETIFVKTTNEETNTF